MPKGTFARPFNLRHTVRETGRTPPHRTRASMLCPEENKRFDKYAVVDRTDAGQTGEMLYYCPHCDALVKRESISPGRRTDEIIDPEHVEPR